MSVKMKSRIMILFSGFLWSTMGIFTRNVTLPSFASNTVRYLTASVTIWIILKLQGRKLNFRGVKENLVLIVFASFVLTITSVLLFKSYDYISIAKGSTCYFFYPVIIVIVSRVLFKERVSKWKIVCFTLTLIGIIMTAGSVPDASESNPALGVAYALASGVIYGYIAISGKMIKSISGIELALSEFVIGAVISLILSLIFEHGTPLVMTGSSAVSILILGVLQTGTAFVCFYSAIRNLSANEVAMLCYFEPASAVFISYVVLRESTSVVQFAGAAIVIISMLLSELQPGNAVQKVYAKK